MSIKLETYPFLAINPDNSKALERELEDYKKSLELYCSQLGEFAYRVTSYRSGWSRNDT